MSQTIKGDSVLVRPQRTRHGLLAVGTRVLVEQYCMALAVSEGGFPPDQDYTLAREEGEGCTRSILVLSTAVVRMVFCHVVTAVDERNVTLTSYDGKRIATVILREAEQAPAINSFYAEYTSGVYTRCE